MYHVKVKNLQVITIALSKCNCAYKFDVRTICCSYKLTYLHRYLHITYFHNYKKINFMRRIVWLRLNTLKYKYKIE